MPWFLFTQKENNMALSSKAKKRFEVAMARRAEAQEIIDAIEAGGNAQAEAVADAGTIAGTYANGAEPTGAEVDATVQEVADKVDEILAALRAAGLMAE